MHVLLPRTKAATPATHLAYHHTCLRQIRLLRTERSWTLQKHCWINSSQGCDNHRGTARPDGWSAWCKPSLPTTSWSTARAEVLSAVQTENHSCPVEAYSQTSQVADHAFDPMSETPRYPASQVLRPTNVTRPTVALVRVVLLRGTVPTGLERSSGCAALS